MTSISENIDKLKQKISEEQSKVTKKHNISINNKLDNDLQNFLKLIDVNILLSLGFEIVCESINSSSYLLIKSDNGLDEFIKIY